MKNTLSLFVFFVFTLSSCQQNATLQQELDQCQTELDQKTKELAQVLSQAETTKTPEVIVHTVYLKLKDNLAEEDISDLTAAVKTLKGIPQVKNLSSGTFKDLGDDRALKAYGYVLQMEFYSEADYNSYQQDSIHLAFKQIAGNYISGPPATHDFSKK